jgi:hypothetical protein
MNPNPTHPSQPGEHTPLRVGIVGTHFSRGPWIATVQDATGACIAEVYGLTEQQASDRALLIVAAVNSHAQSQARIAELKKALTALESWVVRTSGEVPAIRECGTYRRALAKAQAALNPPPQ